MDEAMQQPYPMAQPAFGHTSEGALPIHLDYDDLIADLKHSLRGEIVQADPETGRSVWVSHRPLVNDKGLNNILTILKSRLTKIFILSDLDQAQIENITVGVGKMVIDDIYYNWAEYGIRDPAAASQILTLVTDTVYATLRKGYMGNYLKFLRTTQSIQEVQHRSTAEVARPQQDGQSFLGAIFKKRRR